MSSTPAPLGGITEADIAHYLSNNPAFFERHAELMASITLTSPHGQRAVSLQERQMEMLRERIKGLEMRMVEMIRHGQENLAIADRIHRTTRRLLLTTDAALLPVRLVQSLQHEFMIPQAALRLWDVAPEHAAQPWAQATGDDARAFAASLSQPYCGANSGLEPAAWLDDGSPVASLAMLPLRQGHGERQNCFGLLVLGSPDPARYTADMGTDFLARIGEVASAALSRLSAPVVA
ncbi:MAG: DUF484 family protein [Ideonella sp. WA131b]|nr:DUF484 family protein [Ideonella sp. WA131b]